MTSDQKFPYWVSDSAFFDAIKKNGILNTSTTNRSTKFSPLPSPASPYTPQQPAPYNILEALARQLQEECARLITAGQIPANQPLLMRGEVIAQNQTYIMEF